MPMVYRTPAWVAERKRSEQQAQTSFDRGIRPVSNLGGGRGGALVAFTEATGSIRS